VPVPGVVVVLFATPLWYANASHFREQLQTLLADPGEQSVRGVVLDALGMSDIDYTGMTVLREILDELGKSEVSFAIARSGQRVRAELTRAGLSPSRIPANRFFPDVDAAVKALSETD
jgi:SulP family sulfate permease